MKRFSGNREYELHQQGVKIGLRGAVKAKCADCMCYWADGRIDCRLPKCPLYPWQPYREDKSTSAKAKNLRSSKQDEALTRVNEARREAR